MSRLLAATLHHSTRWGMVWFGLLFWGSVTNDIATRLWSDTNEVALASAAIAVGLIIGMQAKIRGRWL